MHDRSTAGVTTQGLSRIAGGVALVAALLITGLVARSVLLGPDVEFEPQLAGGPATGDVTGYLGRIDRAARTIEVAQDGAGLRPVSLALTDEASITIHGHQARAGDLAKGMAARVFYEVRSDVKYVTAIEVTEAPAAAKAVSPAGGAATGGPADRPADTTPIVEARPEAESAPIEDTRPEAESAPLVAVRPSPPAPTPGAVQPPPSPPAKPPAPRAPSAPPPSVHTLATPPAKVPRPVASTEVASEASSRPTSPRAPVDSEVADGTAAVEWLLKGR
jgi:hypothetical protein